MEVDLDITSLQTTPCEVLIHPVKGRMFLITLTPSLYLLISKQKNNISQTIGEIYLNPVDLRMRRAVSADFLTQDDIEHLNQIVKNIKSLYIVQSSHLYYYDDISGLRRYHDEEYEYIITESCGDISNGGTFSSLYAVDESREIVKREKLNDSLPVDGSIEFLSKSFEIPLNYLDQFRGLFNQLRPDSDYHAEFGIYVPYELSRDSDDLIAVGPGYTYDLFIENTKLNNATKALEEIDSKLYHQLGERETDINVYRVPSSVCVVMQIGDEKYILEKERRAPFNPRLEHEGRIYPVDMTHQGRYSENPMRGIMKSIIRDYTENLYQEKRLIVDEVKMFNYYTSEPINFLAAKLHIDQKFYFVVTGIVDPMGDWGNAQNMRITSGLIEIEQTDNIYTLASSSAVYESMPIEDINIFDRASIKAICKAGRFKEVLLSQANAKAYAEQISLYEKRSKICEQNDSLRKYVTMVLYQ